MPSQAQRDTARKAGYDDGVNARARVAQSTKALTAIYDKAHAEGAAQLTRQRTEYEALMDAATDISGAVGAGIDVLFIARGIHASEYYEGKTVDIDRMNAFFNRENTWPTYWSDWLV